MNDIEEYKEKMFEDIKHIDKNGNEYWCARELMPLLEYSKWENFHKVINHAIIACKASNNNALEHFPDFRKVLEVGNKARMNVIDYNLSRYACYLIVQNANPKKKLIQVNRSIIF